MGKVYSILSGKGGVGKTTSVINLAAALNELGKDVLVVDANLSTPNIGLHLGAPLVPITLNHVLDKRAEIIDAIYEHSSGLKILPSSLSIKELKRINHDRLIDIAKELRKLADYILFDSSAGLGREAEASMGAADEIILITQAEMPAIADALKTSKLAESLNRDVRGFILNRHRSLRTEMPLQNIKDMLELPHLGTVPEDRNMQKALALKNALVYTHPRSIASREYRKIAEKLLGEQYLKQQEEKEKSFWQRIFGR